MVQTAGSEKRTMALVAVLAMLLFSVYAQCTPSTCPDGPVLVRFAYANCSGPHMISSFAQPAGCNNAGTLVSISASEMGLYSIDNDQCDLTLANASYSGSAYRFGVCGAFPAKKRDARGDERSNSIFADPVALLASLFALSDEVDDDFMARDSLEGSDSPFQSYMVLFNVNTSFPSSPQTHFELDPSIPASTMLGGSEECYSANNCTAPFYRTEYSQYDCMGTTTSYMYPGFKLDGTCFNSYNTTYLRYTCTGEHSYQNSFHYGDSCDVPTYYYSFERAVCSAKSQLTLTCPTASPFNPTQGSQPDSSAKSLNTLVGATMAFFCLIFFVIFF